MSTVETSAATAAMPAAQPATQPAEGRPRRRYPRPLSPPHLRKRQAVRGWRHELSPAQRRGKRLLDLLLCALLGLPAALVVAVAAVAVRLESPGPALFGQERVGEHGRPFRMWKLRTMVQNAQAMEKDLRHLSEIPWPDFKITRDPRVTRIGAWLRRTSIDELPQLWNVLRGEMSVIGPRPTLFGIADYQLWQTERLAAPPGLTGLWQVLERAECDFNERLRLDLAYIRNHSLWLDLAILWHTAGAVVRGRGAK